MTPEDYDTWVNHPQTKQFHQYLTDYRQYMMERWASGALAGNDNLMAIARAQMAEEIVSLEPSAISEFYRTTEAK